MSCRKFVRDLLAGLALVALAGTAAAEPLRIGTITLKPSNEFRDFETVTGYLAGQLDGTGYDGVEVVFQSTIAEMARTMENGGIDVYIDSPLPVLMVASASGGRIALRRWKRGVASYRSVIVTRNDSEIESVADLTGRLVAAEEPYSSTGYLLPRLAMEREGAIFSEISSLRAPVPADRIGLAFSGGDKNTAEWVRRGRAAAGFLSEKDAKEWMGDAPDELRILFSTPTIPRNMVSFAPSVSPEQGEALTRILIAMAETPDGRAALKGYEGTTRFDALPDEDRAYLDDLAGPLRRLAAPY